MFLQGPIFPLIMTVFTLFMVIIQSIQNQKLLKKRFSLSFFNIAIAVVIVVIFENHIMNNELYKDIYMGYTLFVYIIYFLVFISSFRTSTLKANHYQLFVKSIKESKWSAFYVVDRKERIKDMSESFLEELNLELDDVIGKKLFNIFNKTIRITHFDGKEINSKSLENYYFNYRKEAQQGDAFKEELVILNSEGKQVIFNLMMQPVYVLGKYRGRIVVGEKKTDFDLLGVEKKLNESNQYLESIKHKFIATFEISKEGLFTIDLDDKSIWASNALIKMLGLPEPTMNLDDFRKLFHPEDLATYLSMIAELSLSKQQYYIKYRIYNKGSYMWVEERGKRIFEDQTTSTIMGSLNPVPTRHHQASNIAILDELGTYHELIIKMHNLVNEDKYFLTMIIELSNIPKINADYGWEVGNMFLAEYLSKMQETFVTESGAIYRISGLKFVILVTDPRKKEYLENNIRNQTNFLNIAMQYGSIQTELNVFAGISISKEDGYKEEHLYQAAEQALMAAKNPQFSHQGVFYKDVFTNE